MWSRNITLLISSQWISCFGSKLHELALPLIIYQTTGSAKLLAIGFMVETLPWVILAPSLAPLLDRFSAKRILLCADLARFALCAFLAISPNNTTTFLITMFLIGTFNCIYGTFRLKVIRGSALSDQLPAVLSISNSGTEALQIAAPAAGGFLLALGVSAPLLLLVDGITFLISAFLMVYLHYGDRVVEQEDEKKESRLIGYKHLWFIPRMKALTITEVLRSFAEALFIPLIVVLIKECFGLVEEYLGWAQASMSVGAFGMTFFFVKVNSPIAKAIGPSLALMILAGMQLVLLGGGSAVVLLLVMAFIGALMAFRQLSAELGLLESISDEISTSVISVYNSMISFAYILGYLLSAIMPNFIYSIILAASVCFIGSIYQGHTERRVYVRT